MRLTRLRADLRTAVRALASADLWQAGASASARDAGTGWRLLTPADVDADALSERDLILLSAAGERLEGSAPLPADACVHLRVHAAVPEAGALVLSRPPLASVLADDSRHLPPVSRRLARLGGGVRCVPYAPAGSEALARLVADALGRRGACLLAGRGAAALGRTPGHAVEALAVLERVAGAYAAAMLAGHRLRRLKSEEMARAVRYAGGPLRPIGQGAAEREGARWPDPRC